MTDSPVELGTKLGLKPDFQAYTLYPPVGYKNTLPYPVAISKIQKLEPDLDWLQAFYLNKADLEKDIENLVKTLLPTGQLWLCWPKKSSKLKTDLSDNAVREIGLAAGLIDVKVAAIDDSWSGLKFVYRLKDR